MPNNSQEKIILEANNLLRKYLLPKVSIIDFLNNKPDGDHVFIRTENHKKDRGVGEIKAPNNKRLNNVLSDNPDPFNKEFNSGYANVNDIVNVEDLWIGQEIKDTVQNPISMAARIPYNVQNPISDKDYLKLKALRKELKASNEPESAKVLKSLKLLSRVAGMHNGKDSIGLRKFYVTNKTTGNIICKLDYVKHPTRETIDGYCQAVKQMIEAGKLPKDILKANPFLLFKNLLIEGGGLRLSEEDITIINDFLKRKGVTKKIQDTEMHSFKQTIATYLTPEFYEEHKELVNKRINKKTEKELIALNSKDKEFNKQVLDLFQNDPNIKISYKYEEDKQLKSENRREYILKSGMQHKDILLFTKHILTQKEIDERQNERKMIYSKEEILELQNKMQE